MRNQKNANKKVTGENTSDLEGNFQIYINSNDHIRFVIKNLLEYQNLLINRSDIKPKDLFLFSIKLIRLIKKFDYNSVNIFSEKQKNRN